MTQTDTKSTSKFDPNLHLTQLSGKAYLEVKYRLVWFRDEHPHGKITSEMLHLDLEKGVAVFRATIDDGEGGVGTGHGSETVKDFRDYIEKAETKAQGRALAALGYGTQFAPELEEGERIVDSPVKTNGQAAQAGATDTGAVNKAKINDLLKEYQALCPEACTEKNWPFKALRKALHIEQGALPHPDHYEGAHVVALSQFVRDAREQKAS